MYALYIDESGYTPGVKFDPNQPITVVLGILVDQTKLNKAIREFDKILNSVNSRLPSGYEIDELKFSDIRNKPPFKTLFPKVQDRADFLENTIVKFTKEISYKVLYCAIDNGLFQSVRRNQPVLKKHLGQSYLCASYRVLSLLERRHRNKSGNKGMTFVVFDEQTRYQNQIQSLVNNPIHIPEFTQIWDTAYFGKSHYSKLIQIADLLAGCIRFYLQQKKKGKTGDYYTTRVKGVIDKIDKSIVNTVNCFESDLDSVYKQFEIRHK